MTGFIGTGNIPTPISPQEITEIKKRMGVEEPKYKIDVALGDVVKITDGPFKDYEGKINDLDESKGRIKVLITLFGRETPVDLDFLQAKKV